MNMKLANDDSGDYILRLTKQEMKAITKALKIAIDSYKN